MLRNALNSLLDGFSLTEQEAFDSMELMISGQPSPEQVAAFLAAIRTKKETSDEIVGFVRALEKHRVPLRVQSPDLIDNCGTGGDGAGTFNISSAAALIVASAGGKVAKHGNRSVSSRSGSADVMEALGIKTDFSPQKTSEMIDQLGFGFLLAPLFHPGFKNVQKVRNSLQIRTVFNLLGPLINPARVNRQVLGVSHPQKILLFIEVLKKLGRQEALVISGHEGLDEISLQGPTQAAHLKSGEIRYFTIHPHHLGLKPVSTSELKGGSAKQNAVLIEGIFSGKKGPQRDVVLMNAGASLWVAGKAQNLEDGYRLATETVDSGQTQFLLNCLREVV